MEAEGARHERHDACRAGSGNYASYAINILILLDWNQVFKHIDPREISQDVLLGRNEQRCSETGKCLLTLSKA